MGFLGSFGKGLATLSPLASLIPGIGMPLALGLGTAGSALSLYANKPKYLDTGYLDDEQARIQNMMNPDSGINRQYWDLMRQNAVAGAVAPVAAGGNNYAARGMGTQASNVLQSAAINDATTKGADIATSGFGDRMANMQQTGTQAMSSLNQQRMGIGQTNAQLGQDYQNSWLSLGENAVKSGISMYAQKKNDELQAEWMKRFSIPKPTVEGDPTLGTTLGVAGSNPNNAYGVGLGGGNPYSNNAQSGSSGGGPPAAFDDSMLFNQVNRMANFEPTDDMGNMMPPYKKMDSLTGQQTDEFGNYIGDQNAYKAYDMPSSQVGSGYDFPNLAAMFKPANRYQGMQPMQLQQPFQKRGFGSSPLMNLGSLWGGGY